MKDKNKHILEILKKEMRGELCLADFKSFFIKLRVLLLHEFTD